MPGGAGSESSKSIDDLDSLRHRMIDSWRAVQSLIVRPASCQSFCNGDYDLDSVYMVYIHIGPGILHRAYDLLLCVVLPHL